MNDTVPETWHARELPVLRAIARQLERGPIRQPVQLADITAETGFSDEDVIRALDILGHADMIDVELNRMTLNARVLRISAEARRRVGQWPTGQTALDRIIAALEAIAANTDDTDTRTNARKFADWLRASGTTVGLSVASAAITGQMPSAGS